MLPFKSYMKDEILVELNTFLTGMEGQYEITSHPHKNAFGELCGKPKKNKRKNKWTEDDLMSFKQLGYAVCHNTLDSHGRKVYIHHNMRTFKEKKQ
tara:strand:- start:1529 stop:1816 length:288 start_codon:yes stop_codon:yes gene_type:complete